MGDEVIGLSADGGGYLVRGPDGTVRSVPGATPMRGELPPVGGRLTPAESEVLGLSQPTGYQASPPPDVRGPVMLEEQRIAASPDWAQGLTPDEAAVLREFAPMDAVRQGAIDLPAQPVSAASVIEDARRAGGAMASPLGPMLPAIDVESGPVPAGPPPPSSAEVAQPLGPAAPGVKPGGGPVVPATAPAAAADAATSAVAATPGGLQEQVDLPRTSRDIRGERIENVTRYGGQSNEVREGIMDAARDAGEYSDLEQAAYRRVADVIGEQRRIEEAALRENADLERRARENVDVLTGIARKARITEPTRSVGRTIQDILAAALGGFGSGILGTEDVVFQAIQQRIADDMERQRNNAALAQENVEAAMREAARRSGVAASEAEMRESNRSLALEEAATEVRQYASGIQNEEVQARMLALAGNLDNEVVQIREGIYRSLEDGMRRDERVRSGGSRPSGRIPGVRVVDPVTGETTFVDVFSYGSGGNFRDAREALAARTAAANGVAGNISTMSGVERAESPRPEAARPDDWFRPRNLTRDPSASPAPERVLREILEADNALSNWSDGVTRLKELTRNGANFASPEGRAAVGALAGVMRTRFGTRIYQSALQTHEMEDLDNILSHPNDITPAVMQTWLPRMNEITRLMRREVNALGESAGYRPAGVDRRQRPMGEVLQESGASSGQRLPPGVRPLRR